jgi:16S rRNA processing protein RimM
MTSDVDEPAVGKPAVEKPDVGGRIGAPFGVKGWLHLSSFLAPAGTLFELEELWFGRGGRWQVLVLEEVRPHGKAFVGRVAGVSDRDQAALMRGADIGMRRAALPPLEVGEFYWSDLMGMRVESSTGDVLGTVEGFMETGAYDVMVVGGERERLIPFAMGDTVETVAPEDGVIVVNWHSDD